MSRKVTFKENMNSSAPDISTDLSHGQAIDFEINLFDMARQALRRRKLIFGLSFGITVIVAVLLFMQPNLYTSTATILPSGKSTGNISALKSLVGLNTPMMMSDENSSALFPTILKSNLVAEAVLAKTYTFVDGSIEKSLSLKEYFDQTDPDKLRKSLRDITTIKTSQKTGEIALGVETAYPGFSQAILAEYITQLEDFNLHKRQSSAKNNEKYLARQLEQLGQELNKAEDDLEAFRLANLDWASSGSPEILKEIGRLQRRVDEKSSTYTMLQQQYEMAKLDAQKDVPIVRLLDTPSLPTQKSRPFRRNIILLTAVISFGLITFGVILWNIIMAGINGNNKRDFDSFRDELRNAFPRTRTVVEKIRAVRHHSMTH